MAGGYIHGRSAGFSASHVLESLGDALGDIKRADELSDRELGAVFVKSEDRAERYRKGDEMGVVAFVRGLREWGGRFADPALRYAGYRVTPIDAATGAAPDRHAPGCIGRLLLELQCAVEDDDVIDAAELAAMEPQLRHALTLIERLLHRRGRA